MSIFTETQRLAKVKLRQLNLRQTTGFLTLIDDLLLIVGECIVVTNHENFCENYLIEQEEHSMCSAGYTTTIHIYGVDKKF